MPGTVLSMQNIYLVKKNYANPPEGDTKPPEDSASMKFVYHQLNSTSTEAKYTEKLFSDSSTETWNENILTAHYFWEFNATEIVILRICSTFAQWDQNLSKIES